MSNAKYENLKRLHKAEGQLTYFLAVFGDELARREGYHDVDGMDAVHFYLIHKFGWLPRDVRAMSPEDLRFVLSEEMKGWTVPEIAR
jgi:hypothetical protein